MLTKLNNKTVQGERFIVFVPDIHTVVYEEDQRTARIEIEGGISGGHVNWLVYSGTLSGWSVEDGYERMSTEDSANVLRSISDSLNLLDMPHEVV